jgi:hypothetical protein
VSPESGDSRGEDSTDVIDRDEHPGPAGRKSPEPGDSPSPQWLYRFCLIAMARHRPRAVDPVLRYPHMANRRIPVMTNHMPGSKPAAGPP